MRAPSLDTTTTSITDDLACETRCVDPGAIQTARIAISDRDLEASAVLLSAMGDLTRLRLVAALLEGPLCTCDLATVLGVSDSAVSHQLRLLKGLQLVTSRREGRIVYHELAGEHVARFVAGVHTHTREVIAAS